MCSDPARAEIVGVGAVGVLPGQQEGILSRLPAGPRFRLAAFSDEGLEGPGPEQTPVPYYADYNMLLQDEGVELVLVGGPVELRRDLAVRALNAGRHVVTDWPFCETALDGERVMKTALGRGLVATVELPWRDDPDLLALRAALHAEQVEKIDGIFLFEAAPPPPPQPELSLEGLFEEPTLSAAALVMPGDEEPPAVTPGGLFDTTGTAVLEQLRLVAAQDVRDVTAHLQRRAPRGPEDGYLLYLALRGGGWAIANVARPRAESLPRWAVASAGLAITAAGGRAVATAAKETRAYDAPSAPVDFWENLYAAVRAGSELKCHPVDVVRAMKLFEAAVESAEFGEPITV